MGLWRKFNFFFIESTGVFQFLNNFWLLVLMPTKLFRDTLYIIGNVLNACREILAIQLHVMAENMTLQYHLRLTLSSFEITYGCSFWCLQNSVEALLKYLVMSGMHAVTILAIQPHILAENMTLRLYLQLTSGNFEITYGCLFWCLQNFVDKLL